MFALTACLWSNPELLSLHFSWLTFASGTLTDVYSLKTGSLLWLYSSCLWSLWGPSRSFASSSGGANLKTSLGKAWLPVCLGLSPVCWCWWPSWCSSGAPFLRFLASWAAPTCSAQLTDLVPSGWLRPSVGSHFHSWALVFPSSLFWTCKGLSATYFWRSACCGGLGTKSGFL